MAIWRFIMRVRAVALLVLVLESSAGALITGGSRAANDMAIKIGLDVVPTKAKVTAKDHAVMPTIAWDKTVERFFWGELRPVSSMQHVTNKESFPLVLLPGILSAESLTRALSLLKGDSSMLSVVEEIEQHELVHGSVRTLRRSLVSQLNSSGELLDMLTSKLPAALVDCSDGHPYEDGSAVFYRRAKGDFYAQHHDSCSPGETLRSRQRAYTILIYLRVPSGPPSNGGTEFTRLTPTDDIPYERGEGGRGLVIKPHAGDALVWPNFDREGKPYKNSLHRALPLAPPRIGRKEDINTSGILAPKSEDDDIGKVVLNLWFEGHMQLQSASEEKA